MNVDDSATPALNTMIVVIMEVCSTWGEGAHEGHLYPDMFEDSARLRTWV